MVVSQNVAVKHFSRKCDLMTKRNLTFAKAIILANIALSYQKFFEKPRVIVLARHSNLRAKKNIFKSTKICWIQKWNSLRPTQYLVLVRSVNGIFDVNEIFNVNENFNLMKWEPEVFSEVASTIINRMWLSFVWIINSSCLGFTSVVSHFSFLPTSLFRL